jgi:hypothetical protein
MLKITYVDAPSKTYGQCVITSDLRSPTRLQAVRAVLKCRPAHTQSTPCPCPPQAVKTRIRLPFGAPMPFGFISCAEAGWPEVTFGEQVHAS